MSDAPLTLYGDRFWISPFVFSCFVAMRAKELKFTVVDLGLDRGDQRKPDYVDKTLTGKVPALDHDGFWLSESSAILDYLEDAFPAPRFARILPADVHERARARQILAWLRTDMNALRDDRPTTSMFYARADAPLSDAGRAAADRLLRVANQLIAEDHTSMFREWNIADTELAFMLQRLALNGHDIGDKLQSFVDVQWSRPAVHEYVVRPRADYVPY